MLCLGDSDFPHFFDRFAGQHGGTREDVIEVIGLRDERERGCEGCLAVLSTVVGMVMAGMEAPSEPKKETRSNACPAASDIFGGSGRETRSEIRQKFRRICSGMRCGASGEPNGQ